MPLTKCPRCDKLFNKEASPVCTACQESEDTDHDLIRDTLEENPDLNAEQVSELTGVGIDCVLRMIDEGKIVAASAGELEEIKCGRCGKPAISATKRLCQACLDKLNQEVAAAQKSIKLGDKKDVEVGGYSGMTVREDIQDKHR